MFSWLKRGKKSSTNVEATPQQEVQRNFDDNIAKNILSSIKEEFGLDYSKQEYITMRKIERFAIKNDLVDFKELQTLLKTSPKVKEELINMLTVGETYFYREIGHFKILSQLLATHPIKKILCAPSSSGEEIYSILIYLHHSLQHNKNIHITGIDINSDALFKAKEACYSQRSTSLLPKELLEKFFTFKQNRYCIDERMKRDVNFLHQNIFDKSIYTLGKFDVIFCRNMLIYFNNEQKKDALATLRELLVDKGILFIGHADISFELSGFQKKSCNEGSYYIKI